MRIDGISGHMLHTQLHSQPGNLMDLRAEMDLLVALGACPNLAVSSELMDVSIDNS